MTIWEVRFESSTGEIVEVVKERDMDILSPFLPESGDSRYPYISYIDPNGDTLFSAYQMPQLLREWDQVFARAPSPRQRVLVDAVRNLILRCNDANFASSPGRWLRFLGD